MSDAQVDGPRSTARAIYVSPSPPGRRVGSWRLTGSQIRVTFFHTEDSFVTLTLIRVRDPFVTMRRIWAGDGEFIGGGSEARGSAILAPFDCRD